jgi:EAL domain-containing protein (putative c-di-GMP-specific phosphodiesterase class I)
MPSRRLVVLDDEPLFRDFVCRVAQACGFETFDTGSPGIFESDIRRERPLAIIIDLMMPDVDGVELLRNLSEELAGIPILIASGLDSRLLDTALRLGEARGLTMAGTIQKPIRPAALREILEKIAGPETMPTEGRLVEAIGKREFEVYYQPYLDLHSRRIVGAEALIRWPSPDRGHVPPGVFIPLAEQSTLIDRITSFVLTEATSQAARWRGHEPPLDISINLSAKNIRDLKFPDQVLAICRQHDMEPSRIVFELTETATMQDAVLMMDVATRLRLKGFRLAIDDFGTGYSSLSQLRRLPFSEMKIDLTFVSTMLSSRDSEVIVKTIINMAHNLGMRAIAEGVENMATLERLIDMGCDIAQGFLIARPMPADELGRFLASHTTRA